VLPTCGIRLGRVYIPYGRDAVLAIGENWNASVKARGEALKV